MLGGIRAVFRHRNVWLIFIGCGAITGPMLAFGSPLAGALSDRLGRRKLPLVVGGGIAALLWGVQIYAPGLPHAVLVAIMIGLGIASGVVVIGFAFCKKSAPAALAGTASGIANMGNMLGGMAMQPLIGLLLDLGWSGRVSGGSAHVRLRRLRGRLHADAGMAARGTCSVRFRE